MKTILSFCLLLLIVDAAFGTMGKICEPGTHWQEDCNSCFCTNDGTGKACTRMACLPTPQDKMNTEMLPKPCEPNSHFKDKCNDCWCGSDGKVAACTMMACLDQTGPVKV